MKPNHKYILNAGTPYSMKVTFIEPVTEKRCKVRNKRGITYNVSINDLSALPESSFSKISKWVGSTLITIAVKEAFGGLFKAFKK